MSDVSPSGITAEELNKLIDQMRNLEVEFAEERTRVAADAMLAAAAAKDSAEEVQRSLTRAKERLTRFRRKIVLGLLGTFVASIITAYCAIYFHEMVRSHCYQTEPLHGVLRDVRVANAPGYCFVFPGTGVRDSQGHHH